MRPPERFKTEDQLEGDELVALLQAQRAGEPLPRFESEAYAEFRADALRSAGLHAEAEDSEPGQDRALEDMTPAQHLEQIRKSQ